MSALAGPFTMPDLSPAGGFVDTDELRHAPPLEAVFASASADEAARVQARRRLVPTLRLEDALRSLTRLGASLEAIRIVPIGIERSWKGEVIGQWPAAGTQVDAGTRLLLFVTLAGLQDRLPDGLLPSPVSRDGHQAPPIDASEAADELLLEYRELDPGRRLLQILDSWLGRARAALHLLQDAYDGVGAAEPLARHLIATVHLDGLPADGDGAVWLSGTLFHLASAIGVGEPAGELLSAILEERTRVAEAAPESVPIPLELRSHLGARNSRLGRDLVAGRSFEDARPSAAVVTGPESAPQARADVVEEDRRARAAGWTAACLPGADRPRIRHDVVPGDRVTRLGRGAANAVLGVTTYMPRSNGPAARPETP